MLVTKLSKTFYHILFWALLINHVSSKKKSKTLLILQAQVQYNPVYLEKHTLDIKEDRTSVDVLLNVARNFSLDPWVEFGVGLRQTKNDSYRSIFAYNINVCQLLGKESRNDQLNFVQILLNNFWKYGNMPKSCPILKGNYHWFGLKVEQMSLPQFLLSGKYRVIIKTYFRKEKINLLHDSVANLTLIVMLK